MKHQEELKSRRLQGKRGEEEEKERGKHETRARGRHEVILGKRGILGYRATQARILKINPSMHLIHHHDILSLFKFQCECAGTQTRRLSQI